MKNYTIFLDLLFAAIDVRQQGEEQVTSWIYNFINPP